MKDEAIEVTQLRLVDTEGNLRMKLTAHSTGASFGMFTKTAETTSFEDANVLLELEDDGTSTLVFRGDKPGGWGILRRDDDGAMSIEFQAPGRKSVLSISVDDGDALISLATKDVKTQISLEVHENGTYNVVVFKDGKLAWSQPPFSPKSEE